MRRPRAEERVIDPDKLLDRLRIEHVTTPSLEQTVADLGITIVTTRRGIDGERRWFQCPGEECGRRCSTLYLAEEGLLCSGCAEVSAEKPRRQARSGRRQRARVDMSALRIERNHVPPARPISAAKTLRTATATRTDQPPRQLVDAFRRITVDRVLARFGLPVVLDGGLGLHACLRQRDSALRYAANCATPRRNSLVVSLRRASPIGGTYDAGSVGT
jgi:hypothetical protein